MYTLYIYDSDTMEFEPEYDCDLSGCSSLADANREARYYLSRLCPRYRWEVRED